MVPDLSVDNRPYPFSSIGSYVYLSANLMLIAVF